MTHPLGKAKTGQDVTPSDSSQSRMVDYGTAVVLASSAAVSAWLSAQGAHSLFAGSWVRAVIFAGALQVTICIALWQLPKLSLRAKFAIVPAYILAFGFTVGFAYFSMYQANAGEFASLLKGQVIQTFAEITVNTDQLEESARVAEAAAADEDKNGTYSQGVAGKKQEWRKLQKDALARRASSDQAQPTRDKIVAELIALKADGLRAGDIRNIYDEVAAISGRYSAGVKAPDFDKEEKDFPTVVLGAYQIAMGLKHNVTSAERRRVLGSLFSSSVMEILALLASLVRAAALSNRRGSLADFLALPVALLLSLAYLPLEIRARVARIRDLAIETANRWQEAKEQTLEQLKDPNPSVMEGIWAGNLRAQAKEKGRRSISRLVREVLPREVALRHVAGGLPSSTVSLFDAHGFTKKHIMLNCALATRVLSFNNRGELIPGPRWDQWVRYMLQVLADDDEAPPRVKVGARPKLRVVGEQ